MNNLIIVKSPLQIINAIEAIHYFQLNNNILLIIHDNNKKNSFLMDKISKLIKWKKIIHVHKFKKLKVFKEVFFVKKISNQRYNYLLTSNITTLHKLLLANIKREKTIYIDDGLETITRYNETIITNKLNTFNIKYLKYLLFGLKTKIDSNLDFFTYFDIQPYKNTKIFSNELHYFKRKFLSKSNASNISYIVGQPLIETNLLHENDYLDYIQHIIKTTNNNIIYIPHRLEKPNSIVHTLISNKFKIVNIDTPIELYFMEENIYPKNIYSFMTTAFFTLKILYDQTNFYYIDIPDHKILKRQEAIRRIYNMIKTSGIHKLEI